MRICILGWYGTETLGDRAILAGLFKIFAVTFDSFAVQIGSLYPFLTQRTLLEDASVFEEMAPGVAIGFFDVKNKALLQDEIIKSDFVILGGGPIMDLRELEIIAYGFRYARQKSKRTAVLGCGIGPLHDWQFIDVAASIFANSDLIVLRDNRSLERLATSDFRKSNNASTRACSAHDPAILPVGIYLNQRNSDRSNYLAVNFRKFPRPCFQSDIQVTDDFFPKLLVRMSELYDSVLLVPMHTFYIGGDDRAYLSELKLLSGAENIDVIHKPMNLFELFDKYYYASACIGMRYHSVVFQTLLNGNNFIFDYTEKGAGKINSFLELLDHQHHYQDCYINLQEDNSKMSESNAISQVVSALDSKAPRFRFDVRIYEETLSVFKAEISRLW